MDTENKRTQAQTSQAPSRTHHSTEQLHGILLLRFSEETRQELDRHEPSIQSPSKRMSHTPDIYSAPQRSSRWWVKLLLFCVFLGGVVSASTLGILELHVQRLQSVASPLQKVRQFEAQRTQALRKMRQPKYYRTLSRYKQQIQLGLHAIRHIHRISCSSKDPKTSKHTNPQTTLQVWDTWLWMNLGAYYTQLRSKVLSAPNPKRHTHLTLKKVCLQNRASLNRLKKHLWSSAKSLLKNAKVHMRWYGWCQMKWLKWHTHSLYHSKLQTMRQSSCRSVCNGTRSQNREGKTACATCLRQKRQELQISYPTQRRLLQVLDKERRGRCLKWSKGKDGYAGVFHIGEYVWRVQRVLSYTKWLEEYDVCGQKCKQLRKEWGHPVQIKSTHSKALLYLQLWDPQFPTPTPALKKLLQQPIGKTDGSTFWLPAYTAKLLHTPAPRNFWILLHAYDLKNKQRGLLPIRPVPNKKTKMYIHLESLRIHNNGRNTVRFSTVSNHHKWLSFVTLKQLPWERPLAFKKELYCAKPRSLSPYRVDWRAAISLYPMQRNGTPRSLGGKHFYIQDWPRELLFQRGSTRPTLLVSSNRTTESKQMSHAVQDSPADSTRVWSLTPDPYSKGARWKLHSPLELATLHIPIWGTDQETLTQRIDCTRPNKALSLRRFPSNGSFTHSTLNVSSRVHSARNARYFAQIQQEEGEHAFGVSMYSIRTNNTGLVRRVLKRTLRHPYKQLRATRNGFFLAGGPWGSPVRYLSTSGIQTILPAHPHIRYFDPTYHLPSQRIFVIVQYKVLHATPQESLATFLVSQSIQKALP